MKLFFCLALLTFVSNCVVAEDGGAKIIVIKEVVDKVLTEGKDLSVEYTLFNIGDGPAFDVELVDSDFHENDFEIVSGSSSAKWQRIGVNSNVSHTVVVQPLKASPFNFTSAVVQYISTEGAEPTLGFSDELGELNIISTKEYKRLYASHVVEWILFAIWSCPSVLFPYILYYMSKSKYSAYSSKKKH